MEVASHAAQLLKEHELFELLPAHGKVVTLDADLPMKHALDALSSHSATCLPVWDSFQQRFVDVFTCTILAQSTRYVNVPCCHVGVAFALSARSSFTASASSYANHPWSDSHSHTILCRRIASVGSAPPGTAARALPWLGPQPISPDQP